jgi:uncharacterized protein YndB with AHSA1/START domain
MRKLTLLFILVHSLSAYAAVRVLQAAFEVNAPTEKAWSAWATPEGVKTFFAPGCNIEPKVDRAYDIYLDPTARPGSRGAEGMRIVSYEPNRRIAFTWNAPATIPEIRGQRTLVVLEFKPAGANRTQVRFTEMGWGEGEQWDKAYDYFDHAWNGIVLPRFKHAMDIGPIDWKNIPDLKPVVPSMKATLH